MLNSVKNSPNYKYWVIGALAIGMFGSVVDHGSVNIALPSVASDFGTDLATIQWVVIGYALTISALLLPMGRLGDMVGRTNVYVLGTLIFVAGAALAAASPNLSVLVVARIVQGGGAAMSQGTGMAILISTFPEGERGKALGMMMTIIGIGAIAGPSLGGLLVGAFGWQAVFLFSIPLGILAVIASLAILDKTRTGEAGPGSTRGRFDWLGATLSAAALLAVLMPITFGPKWGEVRLAGSDAVGGGAAGSAHADNLRAQMGLEFSANHRFKRGFCRPAMRVHLVGTSDRRAPVGPAVVPEKGLYPRGFLRFPHLSGKLGGLVFDTFLPAEGPRLQSHAGRAHRGARRDVYRSARADQRASVGPLWLENAHVRRAGRFYRRDFHAVQPGRELLPAYGDVGVGLAQHRHGGFFLAEHKLHNERGGTEPVRRGFRVHQPDTEWGQCDQRRHGDGDCNRHHVVYGIPAQSGCS